MDQLAELEARVAHLHARAQRLNVERDFAGSVAEYKKMQRLDDEALALHMREPQPHDLQQHAQLFPAYCSLAPAAAAAPTAPAHARQRALGAVLGALVADAAACGVQWVYNPEHLQALAASRPGLEFMQPPASPFFEYACGRASPYGEQTAVLARSLAAAGGLDCCAYAALLFQALGPGFVGYRDTSTKAFLRRYAAGVLPPLTGSADAQANAFTRLPPLVAMFAGHPELPHLAERMIRVTQDDDTAVAYGVAAAGILQQIILGDSTTAALQRTMDWIAAGESVPTCLASERGARVADALEQAAALANSGPGAAAAQLGRNCHLPTSLQTALHAALHVELQLGIAAPAPARSRRAAALPPAQASSAVRPGAASSECLPCSMGACPLVPGAEPAQHEAAPAPRAAAPAAPGAPAVLPGEAWVRGVRLALSQGGCCASRASFAGACLGAMAGAAAIPEDWRRQVDGYAESERLAEQLVGRLL